MPEILDTPATRIPEMTTTGLPRILIIDDEAAIRESLDTLLTFEGFNVSMAIDGPSGLDALARNQYDLLLLDLALPGESGIDLLPRITEMHPELPVIMITAYGTVGNVVDAIRAGAENFVQKPWDNEKLLADIRTAIARHKAEEEVVQLKRTLKKRYNFENIIGKSDIMLRMFDLIAQVAPSRSTVLIQGESGTGKELIAKALHANSPRRDHPFVPVNTGAVPSELLESTLFGHVKGAFTSAISSKKGLFEVANGGTLFLDEIGTMTMDMQAKILRVLQDRRFMHLGGTSEIQVDVRIIAATNVDLREAVREGKFREDLFYRLNVIFLELQPRSAPDAKTFPCLPLTSSRSTRTRTPQATAPSHPTPSASSWTTSGPATFASSRTPWSAASFCRLAASSRPISYPANSPVRPTPPPCSTIAPEHRSSTSWKRSNAASLPTALSGATGIRPKPPSSSAFRSVPSIRRSSVSTSK